MSDIQDIQLAAKSVRKWRDMEIHLLSKAGCDDLSYRPRNGMSAFGWILAHQAAIYDFSVNMLIEQGSPMNPEMFKLYQPGTSGDWMGTPLSEIQKYYDETEANMLEWARTATSADFDRVIEKGTAPSFFVGMSCREVLTNGFTHMNYHTGHLTAIRRDWEKQKQDE
ncbi:MAG: DinB family protein [Candidatus Thorarchaeota archaeon]